MNKFVVLGLIVLVLTMFNACSYDNEEDLYPEPPIDHNPADTADVDTTVSDNKISYTKDVRPIIAGHCATSGCHVAQGQPPDLSDYAKLKASIDRVKVRAIDQRTMPASGPLSNADILKLQTWIDEGALNN